MATVFSDMKTLTKDLIAEETTDRFDDTFISKAINLGCVDFIDKTEVLDTHWTRLTVANQLWYLIPSGAYEIIRVEWYDASGSKRYTLVKKTMNEMDDEYQYDEDYDENQDWHQTTGNPEAWIPREHDVIGIWPACNIAGDTLYFYGRKKHTDLSADADETDIPEEFRHIPCIYAARMLLRSDNDEKAPSFEAWYKEEVMMAKRTIKDRKKKMPGVWRLYTY
jgi:hypothetical protein